MNKDELINKINEVIEFLTNGMVKVDEREFYGHPNFYLMHSKEEFDDKLLSIITDKNEYDRYDLYYYINSMLKYMLNQYDSHTVVDFVDSNYLPLIIRFIDDKPYIIGCSNKLSQLKGKEITKINGIDINTVISELDNIICYASSAYFKVTLEEYLINTKVLKSLPSLNITDSITISTETDDIVFNKKNIPEYEDIDVSQFMKENYSLEVIDDIAIITYNQCKDEDKMIELVNNLESLDNIKGYIVDLRGNGGGRSSINRHLIEFLNGKNIITLSDERVFSSARMCLIDLKNIGAKIIGTPPGTPLSCFGNCVMQKSLDDVGLKVRGSATYWYYDDEYACHGFTKKDFNEEYKKNPHIIDTKFITVDEEIKQTLDDYLNHQDTVLNVAIEDIKKNIKNL